MAVSALRGGRGGGRAVAALSATLSAAGNWDECEKSEEQDEAKLHWKKASRTKRKIQKTPMVCQYHPVQSTRIWRISSWRER